AGHRAQHDAFADDDAVHEAEEPPDAAIDARGEQRSNLDAHDNRQGFEETRKEGRKLAPFEAQTIRGVVGERDQTEIETDLEYSALVDEVQDQRGDAARACELQILSAVDAH